MAGRRMRAWRPQGARSEIPRQPTTSCTETDPDKGHQNTCPPKKNVAQETELQGVRRPRSQEPTHTRHHTRRRQQAQELYPDHTELFRQWSETMRIINNKVRISRALWHWVEYFFEIRGSRKARVQRPFAIPCSMAIMYGIKHRF